MKTPLTLNIFIFLNVILILTNCSKQNNSELKIDKNRISNIEKLISPNKKFELYLFTIKSQMSFGSSINAIKIVKYDEKPNFSDSDFISVSNSRPFKINWLDDKNIVINTLAIEKNSENKQPFKTELRNYKGFNIENRAFTMFSSMVTSEFTFSEFYEKNGNIIFKNENDSLVFRNENSQFSIAKDYIEINFFERNKYDNKKGLAFDSYKLIPKNNFDFTKLDKFQPLKIID